MKEIRVILLSCAFAALVIGKRVESPELKTEIPKTYEGTCEHAVYLNYLYTYAYIKNDLAKAKKYFTLAKRIQDANCKLDPTLEERLVSIKALLP